MQAIRRWLFWVLSAVLLVPSFIVCFVGALNLIRWSMTLVPDRFYVAYPYLEDATPWLTIGFLGLLGCAAILTNPMRSKHWIWLPVVATLYGIWMPNWEIYGHGRRTMKGEPTEWVRTYIQSDLERRSVEAWYAAKEQGRFECPPSGEPSVSRFGLNGQTLLYEVRCVTRDLGTTVTIPERPGVIVMSVSPDGQEAWYRVSTLGHDPKHPVEWLPALDSHESLVIHQTLASEPPSLFRRNRVAHAN